MFQVAGTYPQLDEVGVNPLWSPATSKSSKRGRMIGCMSISGEIFNFSHLKSMIIVTECVLHVIPEVSCNAKSPQRERDPLRSVHATDDMAIVVSICNKLNVFKV